MILHHEDGRTEETDVWGEGSIAVDSLWKLPALGEHGWKIVSLRWHGTEGVAHLEPAEIPPELLKLSAEA